MVQKGNIAVRWVGLVGGTKLRNIAEDSVEFELVVDEQTHSLLVPYAVTDQTWRYAQRFRVKECRNLRTSSAHTLDSMLVFRARVLLLIMLFLYY